MTILKCTNIETDSRVELTATGRAFTTLFFLYHVLMYKFSCSSVRWISVVFLLTSLPRKEKI